MKIQVTRRHITEGQACFCYACPIALAVQEATGAINVKALPDRITVFPSQGYRSYPTPLKVASFIRAFDRGEKVSPFTFELPIEPAFAYDGKESQDLVIR